MNKDIENGIKYVIETLCVNMPDDYTFYSNYFNSADEMLELFFDSYFEKVEGRSCSHDKTRYTLRKIKNALRDKTNIELKQTYREYRSKGGDIGGITEIDEIAYWCPITLKDTDSAIKLFFNHLCLDKFNKQNHTPELLSKEID